MSNVAEVLTRDEDVRLMPLTRNERFFIEVIRLASFDSDPLPTLDRVQRLRRIFSG